MYSSPPPLCFGSTHQVYHLLFFIYCVFLSFQFGAVEYFLLVVFFTTYFCIY